jgi:hypothetical protein
VYRSAPAPRRRTTWWPLINAVITVVLVWPAKLAFYAASWLTIKATKLSLATTTWTLQQAFRGKRRAEIAPATLAAISTCTLLFPAAAWLWLAAAIHLCWTSDTWWARRKRKRLSDRERILVARVLAGIAAAHLPWPGPWWVRVALVAGACLAGAVPWWRGRGARSGEPAVLARWRDEVVPLVPKLAGTWTEFDEDAGAGVLELDSAQSFEAAKLDPEAEWALHQPPGTVTISADPRLSRRCVRVAFSNPLDGGRMRFWDGPTLTPGAEFTVMYGKGSLEMKGRLRKADGAVHIAIVAPQGSGKGSIQRLIALEAALSPDILLIGICGKRGKGIGYLQAGFAYLAREPEEWLPTAEGVLAELERRESEPGNDDSFVLTPGRPQIILMIDENPKVVSAFPRIGVILDEITARGRSLGISVVIAMQKGDGPSYGSTRTRANIFGQNGWLWAGPATDQQARVTMLQGFDFDPATLPQEAGWAAIMGLALGNQPVVAGRTLWIPNRLDVRKAIEAGETEAEACPFGTVEDWLERDAIIPEVSPEGLAALGLLPPDPVALGDPDAAVVIEPARATPLHAVPDRPADVWTRIREQLAQHPAGLRRGELAELVGCTPRHASDVLKAHRGELEQDDDRWMLRETA